MNIAERNKKIQKQIRQRKKYQRFGPNQKKILLLLLGGLALSCTQSPRKQWKIIKGMRASWEDINQQAAERAVEALYESRLLEARENTDGTHTLVLNEKGKRRALTYRLYAMRIRPTGPWNDKWRIILYDIPEDEREVRNAFREHLTRLGLRKLQHSAGITPFECKDEIDFIVELLDIRKYVRYIVAEHIDNEAYWKHVFKLDRRI